ncbi:MULTISPECIES: iron ABC transporter permease [unclassified Chelatococcus]|uniref:ABC transporter permease n=1 Tax=unclassified Chelatococcus TaxID=2638111 RepID=UPI001BCF91CD|nr:MULTISPECIES: iron ABC transporter permease [unclassified Chelatococcus]MBS7743090.1 iron ABC transporter permease [Chelatococcus sp. HY11]MBX3541792.1 iron ABC transporter permease [Chelatococcus sp.]MCO5074316.1 iron ABC transporter permease [Chelatococcus sp.]
MAGDGAAVSRMADAIASPAILKVLLDTFIVVIASTTLALCIGATFAWINERTDANLGFAADILPLVPLLVPQIAGVTGWVTLLSPQAGFLNAALRNVLAAFGFEFDTGPINIFSYAGLICVMTLYLVPYGYLIISSALQQLNPSLEEAARISGASPFKTLRRVTLPAIKPAIMNAAIIVFIFGISLFSVPIVIGTGAGIDLLSVRIYRLLYNYPPRMEQAIALSFIMMVVVQAAVAAQVLAIRSRTHAEIAGKGQAASRVELGRWRGVAMTSVIIYLLLTAVLPLIALVIVSLQPFWVPTISIDNLNLQNFVFVLFENNLSIRALVNSIGLGIVAATLGMLLSAIFVTYARSVGTRAQAMIEALTALPATIPQTVTGVAIVVTFSGGIINLHGTLAILLLAYLLISLPQSMRSARAAVSQVGQDLVEAAKMAHASQFRIFRRIMFPLMRPGLVAGWVILFIYTSGELTASALLAGTGNPVVGIVLLDLWENGSFPQLAAIAVIMTILDMVVVGGILRFSKLRSAIS